MKLLKKHSQGFSLIELMAAVAIIGILAAIAIPQYEKYKRRARQAEAKNLLASAFTAENTFFTEKGTVTACLGSIGFGIEGQNYYAVGYGYMATGDSQLDDLLGITPVPKVCSPNGAEGVSDNDKSCLNFSWKGDPTNGNKWKAMATCETKIGETAFRYANNEMRPNTVTQSTREYLGTIKAHNEYELRTLGWIGGAAPDIWAIDQSKQVYQISDGVTGNYK